LKIIEQQAEKNKLKMEKELLQNEDNDDDETLIKYGKNNGENLETEIHEKTWYYISNWKNKGLTPKRKKEYRNPRVRHRNKYEKALSKRKSRVPTARTEQKNYKGEPTGIRAGLKRGIKLK